MRDVVIIGVGMHSFGRFPDKSIKALGAFAVSAAMDDANIKMSDLDIAYVGNSLGGALSGQEGVRGQTVLQYCGLSDIPIINVENACASGSTALRGAWLEVASGQSEVALALGVEKMFTGDTPKTLAALAGDSEVELARMGMQFTANYAIHPKYNLLGLMDKYGWSAEDYALCAVKNSRNGAKNPDAQHQRPLNVDEILQSPMIAYPLTLLMCSSIGDGAAAAIVCSQDFVDRVETARPVHIRAAVLESGHIFGSTDHEFNKLSRVLRKAYEEAAIGPEDIDVCEVHDAMAPVELLLYESLGFCGPGEGVDLLRSGATEIQGRHPVNTSGGLTARGHPVGATGLAQVAELVWQLRGEAGARQVPRPPKVALAHNQGGLLLGLDSAAYAVTILST